MSLRKTLETLIRFFHSPFNTKYAHAVVCTVVFVGPADFVFNAYPGRYLSSFQLFQLKRWSTRSLNCISTFSCKRSVCVQVLTSFYGRFFVDERQFFKYTPSISSLHLGQPFFSFIDAASLWRAESSGSQPVYRKLFPHGPHSSKNNFFEIKISQRRVWETPSLSYYGSCQSPLVECGVTACTLSV